jgi:acyl-CoA thioester hydrolase
VVDTQLSARIAKHEVELMHVQMPTVEQVDELPSLMERCIPPEWQDLNGHVNVRHYLELYDAASWPMLEQFGLDERTFLERRQGLFDLEHHLWYRAELHVGDLVSVHSRFIDRSIKRYHGVMFIVNRTRSQLASAFEYVSSGADLEARRTAPLPESFAAELDRMIAVHARLDWPAPVCGVMSP